MAKTPPHLRMDRFRNDEEMFLSSDSRSLHRGKRSAPRTRVCRPCLVWLLDLPEDKYPGVVMDINPRGLRVRSLQLFDVGEKVVVQMMKDDEYQVPFARPLTCEIRRQVDQMGGFTDHGLRIIQEEVKKAPTPKVPLVRRRPTVRRQARTRMHTVDYTVGERGAGGRRR